jgi:hypothetical protein
LVGRRLACHKSTLKYKVTGKNSFRQVFSEKIFGGEARKTAPVGGTAEGARRGNGGFKG